MKEKLNTITTSVIETPIGKMLAGVTNKGICMLEYFEVERIETHEKRFSEEYNFIEGKNKLIGQLELELKEYFIKDRTEFSIPLDLIGSDFQIRVWKELLKISYGSTRSYKEQSIAVGDIKAIRAVAGANGKNRISIIVPCHRVIGSDNTLIGYGGKLWRKQYLLEHESKQLKLF